MPLTTWNMKWMISLTKRLYIKILKNVGADFQELSTNIHFVQQFEMLRKTKESKAYPMLHIIHHFVCNKILFLKIIFYFKIVANKFIGQTVFVTYNTVKTEYLFMHLIVRTTEQKIIFKWYPWSKQTSDTAEHVAQITKNIRQIVWVTTVYINCDTNRLHCHNHNHTAQFVPYHRLHKEFTENKSVFLCFPLKTQNNLRNH